MSSGRGVADEQICVLRPNVNNIDDEMATGVASEGASCVAHTASPEYGGASGVSHSASPAEEVAMKKFMVRGKRFG